jgi:hypothetical protein
LIDLQLQLSRRSEGRRHQPGGADTPAEGILRRVKSAVDHRVPRQRHRRSLVEQEHQSRLAELSGGVELELGERAARAARHRRAVAHPQHADQHIRGFHLLGTNVRRWPVLGGEPRHVDHCHAGPRDRRFDRGDERPVLRVIPELPRVADHDPQRRSHPGLPQSPVLVLSP